MKPTRQAALEWALTQEDPWHRRSWFACQYVDRYDQAIKVLRETLFHPVYGPVNLENMR